MDYLPGEPNMLVSAVNMLLRDGEYDSLDELCAAFDRDVAELKSYLEQYDFTYDAEARRFY